MFNPMSTAEVVRAVGGVLEAAAAGGADDGYRRSQILSALSVCKLLAAEEAGRAEVGEWLEEATAADPRRARGRRLSTPTGAMRSRRGSRP